MNPQDLDDHDRKIDQLLAERSSRLLERMKQGDPSAPENLVEFLFESKRNLRQYMRAVAVDRALERVDRERKWKLAPPSSEDSNVIVLAANAENDSPPPPTRAKRLLWSLAAVLVGSFLLVAWGLSHWLLGERAAEHVFATTVGEQRAIELPDGSVIHLNTQSRLKVYFTEQTRNIQLLAGEALFKVHHEPTRPFVVTTDDATIRAVGTEFNVYRRASGTDVAVLEGRVKVSAAPRALSAASRSDAAPPPSASLAGRTRVATLGAGQQARVTRTGKIATESTRDLSSLAAWRQRRLVFRATRLSDIVAEFNRYNTRPKFVLTDTPGADRVYSGVFDADDPESLAKYLESDGLRVERQGDYAVIRADEATSAPVVAESPER